MDEFNGSLGFCSLVLNRAPSSPNCPCPTVSKDNANEGFTEIIGKKKKRKNYERTNSAKTSERNNKAKNSETPYSFN